ncbi:hypothetical protein KNE206_57430 [Kitasatospora sp. NE20-6]
MRRASPPAAPRRGPGRRGRGGPGGPTGGAGGDAPGPSTARREARSAQVRPAPAGAAQGRGEWAAHHPLGLRTEVRTGRGEGAHLVAYCAAYRRTSHFGLTSTAQAREWLDG